MAHSDRLTWCHSEFSDSHQSKIVGNCKLGKPVHFQKDIEVKNTKEKSTLLQVKVISQKCTSLHIDFKINYLSNVTKEIYFVTSHH